MSSDFARAAFNQADVNQDGVIDRNEFNQLFDGGLNYEAAAFGGYGYGAGLGFGGTFAHDAAGAVVGGDYAGGLNYQEGFDSFGGYGAGGFSGGAGGFSGGAGGFSGGAGGFYGGAGGFSGGAGGFYGGAHGYDAAAYGLHGAGQAYPTDSQGLFQDPSPQVVRRPPATGPQTYTQSIKVRFLQPPAVPPPGPLIIKEVRPPQPPPPPPLRVRQRAPPYPQPPPLVLRERPPPQPPVIPSQTVIRRLAGLPVPPRSVIIERLPPLPPRPRDIIIERWVPYGAQPKRRTIVQRAPPVPSYARPRNVIIQYEPTQARVVHQFQRVGVSAANPQAYVQQFGHRLLDPGSLVQQARAAGVMEDISPPGVVGYGPAAYGQEGVGWNASGLEGGIGFDGSAEAWSGAGLGFGGEFGYGGWLGHGRFAGGPGPFASSYEAGLYGGFGGFDGAGATFAAADLNSDGVLDRGEFNRFIQQGL